MISNAQHNIGEPRPPWHPFAERRRKLPQAQRLDCLADDLAALPVTVDPDTRIEAWAAAMNLALRQNPILYDAAYLELAQRRDLPLAILGAPLSRAAVAEVLGTI